MIQILIFIAIIATAVLIYFNNRVKNRRIDRFNRMAEKQEGLLELLKQEATKTDDDLKD